MQNQRAKRLKPKHRIFVDEYLKDLNATQAYIRAGYQVTQDVARRAAARLLTNVDISRALKKALGKRLTRLEISNDKVLQEAAKIAFANMLDFLKIQEDGSAIVSLKDVTRAQAAALQELNFEEDVSRTADGVVPVRKVKIKLADKRAALDLLGRYLKLFNTETPIQDRRTAKILKEVLADKITVREAAYKFNILGLPIPEAIKIELSKTTPEPPEPDLPPAMSDEELEAGYQEKMKNQDRQATEWLPQRQAEVLELKEAASFGP